MSNKILEPTINKGSIVGVLQEKQLEAVKDIKGEIQNIKGNFVIRVQNGEEIMDLKVPYFVTKLKKDGTENPMFAGGYTILQEFVAATDAARLQREPDRVCATVELQVNDYITKQNKVSTGNMRLRCSSMRRESELEDEALLQVEGMIRSIEREKDENEETGRLTVSFYTISYGGTLNPLNLIVPENLASNFESYYQVGDTVELMVNIVNHRVGKVEEPHTPTFGDTTITGPHVTSGYDVLEYHIVSGFPPNADPNTQLDIEDIKEAEKEREIKIQALYDEAESKKTSSGNPVSSNNPFAQNNFSNTKPLF